MSQNQGKDYSQAQEKAIAKILGGRVQSNSGGTRFGGGDVHTKTFFIEAKTPTSPRMSVSIQWTWLNKMKEQAFEQGKTHSALAFRFDPEGPDYFVIDSRLMRHLVELLEQEED